MREAIQKFGLELTQHVNGKTLADHSVNVAELLKQWGERESLVNAAYFHSVYGREFTKFPPTVDLSNRKLLESYIGAESEALVYLNCAYTANSFWHNFNVRSATSPIIYDRFSGSNRQISQTQLIDILKLNYANMVDHIDFEHFENFRWPELSLYLQNYVHLSELQRRHFDETFRLNSRGVISAS